MSKKKPNLCKVLILCGLPGSGKSHFAQARREQRQAEINKMPSYRDRDAAKGVRVVDMDQMSRYYQTYVGKPILERVLSRNGGDIAYSATRNHEVILDGLFHLQEQYETLARELGDLPLEFHFWAEDREACLWNDQYRRPQDSTASILKLPLDLPDMAKIQALMPEATLVMHEVQRKSLFQMFLDKFELEPYVKSDDWTTGGEWGNCWGERGGYSGEAPPESFDKFDELIEKVWPDISFLQYKKLHKECVSIKEGNSHDYYSSGRDYAFYQLDVRKLYDMLEELGQLPDLS